MNPSFTIVQSPLELNGPLRGSPHRTKFTGERSNLLDNWTHGRLSPSPPTFGAIKMFNKFCAAFILSVLLSGIFASPVAHATLVHLLT
ncbi:hypothetical protein SISSUDRAFT_1051159 [Sistotremastrum suecicum HHB10207 ss-3]|uniref:Uncharacterized protein n=1 Tax=Sistotremastrum suecicum HHB10207 ss-3 TaxID=1314776 RepID=A0A166AR97_9AGAM|nr:hypothetical protein SISSUDRAFT_1051159 [Sistotremastrum suecicum HHB10207 ss-3]